MNTELFFMLDRMHGNWISCKHKNHKLFYESESSLKFRLNLTFSKYF